MFSFKMNCTQFNFICQYIFRKKYKFLKIKKKERKRQMTTAELTAIDGFDRLLQKRGGELHGKHERML